MSFSTFLEEYSTLWLNCFDGNTTLERHRPAAASQSFRGRVTISHPLIGQIPWEIVRL